MNAIYLTKNMFETQDGQRMGPLFIYLLNDIFISSFFFFTLVCFNNSISIKYYYSLYPIDRNSVLIAHC